MRRTQIDLSEAEQQGLLAMAAACVEGAGGG